MRRINDYEFINKKFDLDKIIGIRIENGEFHFIGWMENAENYKIQKANKPYLLNRELIMSSNIYKAITEPDGYNNMSLLWLTNENDELMDKEDLLYVNAYEKFLTLINQSGENHNILIMTKSDIISFCDMLKDGDYVLIIND